MNLFRISARCAQAGCTGGWYFDSDTPMSAWLDTLTQRERIAFFRGYARAVHLVCPTCGQGIDERSCDFGCLRVPEAEPTSESDVPSDLGLIQFPDTPFPLMPSLVLLGRRGSEAHGTFVPTSDPNGIDDRDLMGVCIPPAPWTMGLRVWEGAESFKDVWDVVLYDFRKFVRLLCKQNPNVIGMLWLEREDYLMHDRIGALLIENRSLFRARKPAYDAFIGYAHSQLSKMTRGACQGYMGAKRKALVEKHGYDCKNAAHLVRLLHMGEEFLRRGTLQVRRTWDRELLLEIKRGDWPLERVQRYSAGLFESMKRALEQSVLPEEVDMDRVNDLVVDALRSSLGSP